MFCLLFLHFFLYGCNIFMWRKARINYSFIFELAPTKELKYRDVFLICTTSMTAVMGVLFIHLSLVAKGYSYAQVKAIPGLLLLVIFWFTTIKCFIKLWNISISWTRHSKIKFELFSCATGLLTFTSVPCQHFLQVKPLPVPLRD